MKCGSDDLTYLRWKLSCVSVIRPSSSGLQLGVTGVASGHSLIPYSER